MNSDHADTLRILQSDGPVRHLHIDKYCEYEFTISGFTENYKFQLICGGSSEGMYHFDPYGGWGDWEQAGISFIECNKVTRCGTGY